MESSKSLPSNLATSRRHRGSISGSGSYQSHLSSLGHLHRVRTVSEQISLGPTSPDELDVLEGGLAEQRPRAGRLLLLKQIITDPATFLYDDLRRIHSGHIWRPRTLLALYSCFCIVFFTLKIYTRSREVLQVAADHPSLVSDPHVRGSSPLINISISQRLSVAFRDLSPQAHLDTLVAQAHPSFKSDVTACLWIEDADIADALASAASWPGPVSIVVVTTHPPNSTVYVDVRDHLRYATKHASVHLLYVPVVAGGSFNTYLNMARFFAPTSHVALFPDGIPKSALSGRTRWLDKIPLDTGHPVFLGNATHRTFSPRTLDPVVLPRDHPIWCTERFYMFGSRVFDWDDCLWTLWLESAGEARSIAVPRFVQRPNNVTALSISPSVMKMRLRWSTKYRSEACAFTLKRSQALGPLSKTEKKRMQWRKRFCRETVGPGALENP